MKLYQLSWFLGTWSYVIGGVFRRSGSPPGEMSIGIQGLAIFLLMILPAGIGTVLGAMSLKRKEVKAFFDAGGGRLITLGTDHPTRTLSWWAPSAPWLSREVVDTNARSATPERRSDLPAAPTGPRGRRPVPVQPWRPACTDGPL